MHRSILVLRDVPRAGFVTRRAVTLAAVVAALCGAVLAVAGPGGAVVQFAGCWAVALAGVVLWRHGRDTGGVQ